MLLGSVTWLNYVMAKQLEKCVLMNLHMVKLALNTHTPPYWTLHPTVNKQYKPKEISFKNWSEATVHTHTQTIKDVVEFHCLYRTS